jgi:hypothetical protein
MKLSTHRLRRLAGLGLVVAAMAVPNALAGHEDLGPRGSSEIAQPQLAEHFLPDGYQPQLHGEDAVSRWLRNNPDGYQPQLRGSVEALTGGTAHAGGIDAGVWAGIGSAVTILTVAAALAVRRRGGVTQS